MDKTTGRPAGAPEAEVTFSTGGLGGEFDEDVVAYVDPSAISQRLTDLQQAMSKCPTWKLKDDDGTITTFTASALSFDKLGDQTLAIHLVVDSSAISGVTADVAYVRLGHCGVTLDSIGLASDSSTLVSLAPKAIDKLKAAV